jgi:hypothetical protein
MLVVATGLFPWASARPSDKRYAHWAKAWEWRAWEAPAARTSRLLDALWEVGVGDQGRPVPDDLLLLLVRMLSPCPEDRLSMQEVAVDPWVVAAEEVGGHPGPTAVDAYTSVDVDGVDGELYVDLSDALVDVALVV